MSDQTSNNKWKLVLLIALFTILGVLGGYVYGSNKTESDLKKQYAAQIKDLEDDVSDAKKNASGSITEGQEAVNEGQQTIETLQAENASLKATIEDQNKKITDLEKQLEEANNSNTTPQN